MLFLCHPNCTTCKKALQFLESRDISPQIRDIRTEGPSLEELTAELALEQVSGEEASAEEAPAGESDKNDEE